MVFINFQYSLEIFLNKNGNSRQLMRTSLYDYCLYTKKRSGNSIVEMVAQQIFKNTTLPSGGCPTPANKYFIYNFKLDGAKFPSFVPAGNYIAYWILWTLDKNNVNVVMLKLFLEIKVK